MAEMQDWAEMMGRLTEGLSPAEQRELVAGLLEVRRDAPMPGAPVVDVQREVPGR